MPFVTTPLHDTLSRCRSSRHLFTTYFHDTLSRYRAVRHDTVSRHTFTIPFVTTPLHDTLSRYRHDTSSRHTFTIPFVTTPLRDTLSRYSSRLQYRTRFSKYACKKLIDRVCGAFKRWVDDDPATTRKKLHIIRHLESDDPHDRLLVFKARSLLGGCLVDYAKGSPDSSQSVKPYGLKAARSTSAFLQLPSCTFALTYAVIYQCLRTPQHLLKKWVKKARSNISNPWPKGMIMRFATCQKTFHTHRVAVFEAFEDDGGEFMGEVESTRTPRVMTAEEREMCEEDF